MSGKIEYLEEDEFESVLDKDVDFTGKVLSDNSCLVKGHIQNTKANSKLLVVVEEGKVSGELVCETLTVFGECSGFIQVSSSLSLQKGGHLNGKIKTSSLIVGEGGVLNGECSMEEPK